MKGQDIMATFNAKVDKKTYENFKKLENLTGKECYDKYGLKRDETTEIKIPLSEDFEIILTQTIPFTEESYTYCLALLHDIKRHAYYDTYDCDDTILGEWWFEDDDGNEISVLVEVDK